MDDYDSDSDSDRVQENNTPPRGVDGEFCRCIQTLKWNLYQTIVLGPEPNTPGAQQNELIQVYVKHLGQLYRVFEMALNGKVSDAEMCPFPVTLRHEILKCAQWATAKVNPLSPTDRIPYKDYLNTSLRVYPFVHHMRILGGSDDVENM